MTRSAIVGPLLGASLLAIACGPQVGDAGDAGHDGEGDAGPSSDAGSGVDVPPLEHCGDGVLDDGEACDDGNDVQGDGCNDDCRVSGQLLRRIELTEPAWSNPRSDALAITGAADVIFARRVPDEKGSCVISRHDGAGNSAWRSEVVDAGCLIVRGADSATVPTFGFDILTPELVAWEVVEVADDGEVVEIQRTVDPQRASGLLDLTATNGDRTATLTQAVPPVAMAAEGELRIVFSDLPSTAPIVVPDVVPLALTSTTSLELAALVNLPNADDAGQMHCEVEWFTAAGAPLRVVDVCAFDNDEGRRMTDIASDRHGGVVVSGAGASALLLALDAGGGLRWRMDAPDLFGTPDESLYDTQVAAASDGDVFVVGRRSRAAFESLAWIARVSHDGRVRWSDSIADGASTGSPTAVARAVAVNDEIVWVSGYSTVGSSGEPATWLRAYTP